MTPAEKILREGLSGLQNGNLTKQQIFRLARETMAKADDAGDGWIAVTERAPEEIGSYLIYGKNAEVGYIGWGFWSSAR